MGNDFLLHAVFLLVLSSFGRCNGKCTSSTFDATTSVSFMTNENYGNDEDCTIIIRPSAMHSSGFYLAIKWLVFEVEGEMPECEHDFVEVTLTRSSVSIGKFCSDNLVSTMPFDIYSADGHAQIKFKSDSSVTHAGFKFSYQLKSKPLVPSDSSLNICGNKPPAENMKSGIMYHNGWPVGNQVAPSTFCSQQIDTGLHSETKIFMMDLDLKGSTASQCNASQPNVEILQSSKPYSKRSDMLNFATSISGPMCGKLEPKVYTATERYIYIHFNRANASLIANRGFVIGFLSYGIGHHSANDVIEGIQMLSSLTSLFRRRVTAILRRRTPVILRRRLPVVLRRRTTVPPVILRRRLPVVLRRRTTVPPVILRRRLPVILRRRTTVPPAILRRRLPVVLRRRITVPPVILRRRLPVVLRRRTTIPPVILRRRLPVVLRRRTPVILRRRTPSTTSRRKSSSSGTVKSTEKKTIKVEVPVGVAVGGLIAVVLVALVVAKYVIKVKFLGGNRGGNEGANVMKEDNEVKETDC